jgi:hypothetical protein
METSTGLPSSVALSRLWVEGESTAGAGPITAAERAFLVLAGVAGWAGRAACVGWAAVVRAGTGEGSAAGGDAVGVGAAAGSVTGAVVGVGDRLGEGVGVSAANAGAAVISKPVRSPKAPRPVRMAAVAAALLGRIVVGAMNTVGFMSGDTGRGTARLRIWGVFVSRLHFVRRPGPCDSRCLELRGAVIDADPRRGVAALILRSQPG